MRVAHYIEELLYKYSCVVVPEFGAFLANSVPSKLNPSSKSILPPAKVISFNSKLSRNDGILVAHIAKAKQLPYEAILESVVETSSRWKDKIARGEKLKLNNIGVVVLNPENNMEFLPEHSTNYAVSSFGLAPISAIPVKREVLKDTVETLEERAPLKITPATRETPSLRPWLKYAAIVLLFASLGASGYVLNNRFAYDQEVVEQQVDQEVSKEIQEAVFFDASPLEFPPLTLNVKKTDDTPKPLHFVIAGAFRTQGNAEKKVAQLQNDGHNASVIGQNRFGLYQVAYAGFADKKDALAHLRQIKREVSSDAWLLTKK